MPSAGGKQHDTRKREVRQAGTRWPVTVAAVLAAVAVVLVVFVALRKSSNDVVSFQGTPSEVVIDSSGGSVVVVPAEGNQVQVSRRARWTMFEPDMDVEQVGGSLVVKADCTGPSFLCEVQYHVSVPAAVPVRVLGGGGDVQIERLDADVDVQTSGGDVVLTSMGGAVKVRTSGGDITATSVAGALDFATDGGSITASSLTGPTIQAGTSSGDIDLVVTGLAERIGAGSASGDISIVVPDLAYAVDAQAGSGLVTVDVNEASDASRAISATTGAGQVSITRG